MRFDRVAGLIVWWVCSAVSWGAVPTLTGVVPSGVVPGGAVAVKFSGKLDGVERRVWCDDPQVVFTVPDGAGAASVTVASGTMPGVKWVRLVNAEGASPATRFVVGSVPRVDEKEPNDELSAPQALPVLPAWVHGQLDKAGDVDGYAVKMGKGKPVWMRVDGYSLGSGMDVMMHVVNPRGERVATASDGRNLDPELVFTPEMDGVHVIQIAGFIHPPAADVNFTGAAGKVYQLHVSDGPVVTRVFPPVVPVEGKASVSVHGVGVKAGEKAEAGVRGVVGEVDRGEVMVKGALVPLDVVRARYPVMDGVGAGVESPRLVGVPSVVASRIPAEGKEAAFKVAMKKGERLQARFWSRSLGLGVEGNLVVYNPSGERVVANANPSDVFTEPTVAWSAVVDGEYVLRVGDLFGRCTDRSDFVLEIAAPAAEVAVTLVDGKSIRVEPGKAAVLKAKVVLTGGWKEPLVLRVNGLPDGVWAPEVGVPEKGGDVDIKIEAAANAPLTTSPAWVSVWTKGENARWIGAAYPVRADTRRGHSSTDHGREVWVTAGPALPPEPPPKKK